VRAVELEQEAPAGVGEGEAEGGGSGLPFGDEGGHVLRYAVSTGSTATQEERVWGRRVRGTVYLTVPGKVGTRR
jgi:hypothetical protein